MPTKRSGGLYSFVGSFGRDEYRTLNIDNDKNIPENTSKTMTTF